MQDFLILLEKLDDRLVHQTALLGRMDERGSAHERILETRTLKLDHYADIQTQLLAHLATIQDQLQTVLTTMQVAADERTAQLTRAVDSLVHYFQRLG